MAVDFPERVLFEDHRILQATDLEEQRDYHTQRRWQHNLAMHSWGILCGLTIDCEEIEAQHPRLEVRPGMALDGYGREIVLTSLQSALRPNQLLDPGASYDVWIRFREIGKSNDEAASEDCEIEIGTMHRVHDEPEVFVRQTAQRQSGSVKRPSDVPIEDLEFSASQAMKFDSDILWPVFLGRIERINSVWTLDETERYYGGLIAQRIEFPSDMRQVTSKREATDTKQFGRTMIINGGDPTDKDLRFAVVEIPVDTDTGVLADVTKQNAPLSIRQTKIDPTADDPTKESTQIHLNVDRIVAEGHLQLKDGAGIELQPRAVSESTKRTIGWGIYGELQVPGKQDEPFGSVLQFAMPEDEKGNNRITFGATNKEGEFKAILSINSDQTVDIIGTLRVHKAIAGINSEIPFQPGLLFNEDTQKISLFVESLTQQQLSKVAIGLKSADSAKKTEIYAAITQDILTTITPSGFVKGLDDSDKKHLVGETSKQLSADDFVSGIDLNAANLLEKLTDFSFQKSASQDIVTAVSTLDNSKQKPIYQALIREQKFFDNLEINDKGSLVKAIAAQIPATEFAKAQLAAGDTISKAITQQLAEKNPELFASALIVNQSTSAEVVKALTANDTFTTNLVESSIAAIIAHTSPIRLLKTFDLIPEPPRSILLRQLVMNKSSGFAAAIPQNTEAGEDDPLRELAIAMDEESQKAVLRLAAAITASQNLGDGN